MVEGVAGEGEEAQCFLLPRRQGVQTTIFQNAIHVSAECKTIAELKGSL